MYETKKVRQPECRVCHEPLELDRQDRLSCYECDFWAEKWQIRDNPNVVRVQGQHYVIGPKIADILGMSGRKHVVVFEDGRVITTKNLWHQGVIPEQWRIALPDNASLIVQNG